MYSPFELGKKVLRQPPPHFSQPRGGLDTQPGHLSMSLTLIFDPLCLLKLEVFPRLLLSPLAWFGFPPLGVGLANTSGSWPLTLFLLLPLPAPPTLHPSETGVLTSDLTHPLARHPRTSSQTPSTGHCPKHDWAHHTLGPSSEPPPRNLQRLPPPARPALKPSSLARSLPFPR